MEFKLYLILLVSLMSIGLFSGQLPNDANNQINFNYPTTSFNNNSANVNNSQYLQGYTPTTLYNYYKSLFDLIYQPIGNYLTSDSKGQLEIDHSKFYGYTIYQVTDYSRPLETKVNERVCNPISNNIPGPIRMNCSIVKVTKITYPYTKNESGVDLVKEIDVLRQATYDLNLKNINLQSQINVLTSDNQRIKDCAKLEDYKLYSECVLK